MKGQKTLFSHKSVSYITPSDLFEDLRNAFDIELDPCGHETATLPSIEHTIRTPDNGLEFDWCANTFINPPYSSIELWVDKTIEESKKNPYNYYVMLLPSRTGRPWFRKIMQKSIVICFMDKRLKFEGTPNNAPFDSIIAVFKDHPEDSMSSFQYRVLDSYGYVI
jgi:hypothetical protein